MFTAIIKMTETGRQGALPTAIPAGKRVAGALAQLLILSFLIINCQAGRATSSGPDEGFLARRYVGAAGDTLPYRIFIPDQYDPERHYPLVMFLHGGGGAGTDNISQISGGNRSGAHIWIGPAYRTEYPCFAVAPQLPGLERWDDPASDHLSPYGGLAVELVAYLLNEYALDTKRIYLTGQSRGGWGVWDLVAKRPDLFAAGIPVCGGGNPSLTRAMDHIPIWAFHGALDRTVKVELSRIMVAALRETGGNIRYTEYRLGMHAIWDRAYEEQGLVDWLFAQRKQ